MQKVLIIIFAMAFLFKPALPVMEYLINYDYIVKELCINKDNDNLNCNGKCHLTSELADASDSAENSLPDRKQHLQIDILFLVAITEYHLPGFVSDADNNHSFCPNLYTYLNADATFHPPTLA